MLICHCGATHPYETGPSCAVGAVMDATGWFWVPIDDGDSIWVCPRCWARVGPLVEELVAILGTPSTSLYGLFLLHRRRSTPKKGRAVIEA